MTKEMNCEEYSAFKKQGVEYREIKPGVSSRLFLVDDDWRNIMNKSYESEYVGQETKLKGTYLLLVKFIYENGSGVGTYHSSEIANKGYFDNLPIYPLPMEIDVLSEEEAMLYEGNISAKITFPYSNIYFKEKLSSVKHVNITSLCICKGEYYKEEEWIFSKDEIMFLTPFSTEFC